MIAQRDTIHTDRRSQVASAQAFPDLGGDAVDQSDGQNGNLGVTSCGVDQVQQQSSADSAAMNCTERRDWTTSNRPRRGKPCKAMRGRYRKLVEHLLQRVRQDPCGVAYDE